jgi:hypothetical protein
MPNLEFVIAGISMSYVSQKKTMRIPRLWLRRLRCHLAIKKYRLRKCEVTS